MRQATLLICCLLLASVVADVTLVASDFADDAFTNDAVTDWKVTNSNEGQLVTNCGAISLFGGYNTFGASAKAEKAFNSGVDHSELYISFDLYTIDSWDSENFFVYVDGVQVYKFSTQYNTESVRPANCGWTAFKDRVTSVGIKIAHYRRDFTVTLTSTLDQAPADESWGVRDFYIVAYSDKSTRVVTEEFLASGFVSATTGWNLINVDKGKEFSECKGNKLFGGLNIFGKQTSASKVFSKLKQHYGVVINFDLFLIDSPDGGDFVQLLVDGQFWKFYRPDWNYGEADGNWCGVGWTERVLHVSVFVPHTASQVEIAFNGNFDENRDNESFGINNLRVLTVYCSSCEVAAQEFSDVSFTGGKDWKNDKGADVSSTVQSCSNQSFFGSFNTDISKTINELAAHDGVIVFLRLLSSGNWNDATRVTALVDDAKSLSISPFFEKRQICSKADETIKNYFIQLPHTSKSLTLKLALDGIVGDTNYSIRDLTVLTYQNKLVKVANSEFTAASFSSAEGWLVTGNKGGITTTTCGSLALFGGYNAFGAKTSATKTFSGLNKHSYVFITFQVLFIDTWDRENFQVKVDDEVVHVSTKVDTWNGHQHICGWNAAKEEGYIVQIYVNHSAPTLKLTLQDFLDQDQGDESWGIRNLVVSTGDFNLPRRHKNVRADGTGSGANGGAGAGGAAACVQIFTECEYKGTSLSICDSIPNLREAGWNVPIRAIKIPDGQAVSVFGEQNYAGNKSEITESSNCLTGKNFLLINQLFNIDVEESHPTRLKSQSKNE